MATRPPITETANAVAGGVAFLTLAVSVCTLLTWGELFPHVVEGLRLYWFPDVPIEVAG